MAWKRIALWGLLLLALAATPQIANAGGLRIGVGIGLPIYYRPWGSCYPYYAYPPVYYAPAPVYVAPAPVYVQPVNVPQPAYQVPLSPPPVQAPYQSATPQAGIV